MVFISPLLPLFFLSLPVLKPAPVVNFGTSVVGEVTISMGCKGPFSFGLAGGRGLVNSYQKPGGCVGEI